MALERKIPTTVLVSLALILGMGVAMAAVTIVQVDPNPIAPGEGQVQGSNDLSLESQSLTYSGTNATGVDVDVNNTASTTDHTGDVHITVTDSNGNVLESTTKTSVTFTAGTVTTVSYTFSQERPVDSFSKLEVVVEETG
jgi:hypothetical protein